MKSKYDYILIGKDVLIYGWSREQQDYVEIRLEGPAAEEFHKWHFTREVQQDEFLKNIVKKVSEKVNANPTSE